MVQGLLHAVVQTQLQGLAWVGPWPSPADVSLAVGAQNLTLPTGSTKIDDREYRVSLNSSPEAIAALIRSTF